MAKPDMTTGSYLPVVSGTPYSGSPRPVLLEPPVPLELPDPLELESSSPLEELLNPALEGTP